jgi:hypothetical protein
MLGPASASWNDHLGTAAADDADVVLQARSLFLQHTPQRLAIRLSCRAIKAGQLTIEYEEQLTLGGS